MGTWIWTRQCVTHPPEERVGVVDEDVDGWTPLAWGVQTDTAAVADALLSTSPVDID